MRRKRKKEEGGSKLKVERGEARRIGRRVYRSQLRSCGGGLQVAT
jgi:hypothetical protein